MPLESLLAGRALDDEATRAVGAAFDAAWRTVKASNSPLADAAVAPATREKLARCIFDMAVRGERNHQRLIENALAHLASPHALDA